MIRVLLLLAACFFSLAAPGAGLVTGQYHFEAGVLPVCLNGVYPFTIGNLSNCTVSLKADMKGKLTGEIDLHSLKAPISGNQGLSRSSFFLKLSSTDGKNKVKIQSTLQGAHFLGKATLKSGTSPCDLDISATSLLILAFDAQLTVDARGKVTGTGTVSTCGAQIPVTFHGSSTAKVCTLSARASSGLTWQGKGVPTDTGFTASWSAHAFGVSRKGQNLAIAPN